MLNKLQAFIRQEGLLEKGDTVVCAVSGGADSVALLFALYLMKEPWQLQLSAAHFNHNLRGAESDRDAEFVKDLCHRFDIPVHMAKGNVKPGPKGLEAAAREARYAFLESLPGKIATAHTADDNAETLLMHLVRGTGLRGLGGISPRRGRVIRPMLSVTRAQVLEFLEEYHLQHVEDSSNAGDDFLRNRLRHHVMPLLVEENPRLAENLSAMALRLRADEQALTKLSPVCTDVEQLRQMEPAAQSRSLGALLIQCGVKEPGAEHISLAKSLVDSTNPSAKAHFPGGVILARHYGRLGPAPAPEPLEEQPLQIPGTTDLPSLGLKIHCSFGPTRGLTYDCFTVAPQGRVYIRSRQSGDTMRLQGGTRSLKKLFTDRKIPAAQRSRIPVIADDLGVLAVCGIGANLDRVSQEGLIICFEKRD